MDFNDYIKDMEDNFKSNSGIGLVRGLFKQALDVLVESGYDIEEASALMKGMYKRHCIELFYLIELCWCEREIYGDGEYSIN